MSEVFNEQRSELMSATLPPFKFEEFAELNELESLLRAMSDIAEGIEALRGVAVSEEFFLKSTPPRIGPETSSDHPSSQRSALPEPMGLSLELAVYRFRPSRTRSFAAFPQF